MKRGKKKSGDGMHHYDNAGFGSSERAAGFKTLKDSPDEAADRKAAKSQIKADAVYGQKYLSTNRDFYAHMERQGGGVEIGSSLQYAEEYEAELRQQDPKPRPGRGGGGVNYKSKNMHPARERKEDDEK